MASLKTSFNSGASKNRLQGELYPEIIKTMCDRIINRYYPDKIFLFGSQAQGTQCSDSDVDLLIIIDDTNPLALLKRRDRYGQILRLFQYKRFGLDAIVLTNQEVQKVFAENEGEWDFVLDIINNGINLYERTTKNQ